MTVPSAHEGSRVVVLSGGGLSKSSAVPHDQPRGTFRDVPIPKIATLERWSEDAELVRAWFDERRMACAPVMPNPAHQALARMQFALTPRRCMLVTRNVDGLLQKASAEDVVETRGSLFRLRCAADQSHPRMGVYGLQPRGRRCASCGSPLRPDVVFHDEEPMHVGQVHDAIERCDVFLMVGAPVRSPTVLEWVHLACQHGAHCIEVNPTPGASDLFEEVLREPAEHAIPRLIGRWLGEDELS